MSDPAVSTAPLKLWFTGVSDAVLIFIELKWVGDEGAAVRAVEHTITIEVGVTAVPNLVTVEVTLTLISKLRAVIHRVGSTISVDVSLADHRLVRIIDPYTVIELIGDPISVEVLITGVADPILIAVLRLAPLGVDDLGAVVDRIRDPVAITVGAWVDETAPLLTEEPEATALAREALMLITEPLEGVTAKALAAVTVAIAAALALTRADD